MVSPPTSTPSTAKLFTIGTATMLLVLAVMVMLPHSPYVRWQATRNEAFARLGWIYERIHYDPAPIDIAFIGTSHTLNGIDGLAVAKALAEAGGRTPDGRCLTVANLSIPLFGRNMHWAITRELLEARKPRLIVVELFENESRQSHDYFASVANTRDLVEAPIFVNPSYLKDLSRLPWRQFSLAIQSLSPSAFGLKDRFSLDHYDGSTVDNTRVIQVGGVELTPTRETTTSGASLDEHVRDRLEKRNLHMLGEGMDRYEFAEPIYYYGGLLNLVKRRGIPLRRLYLPTYGQSTEPDLAYGVGADVPMLTDPELMADRTVWYDPDHLNTRGAQTLSNKLGRELAAMFKPAPGVTPVPTSACNFGTPEPPPRVKFHYPRGRL